MHWNYRVIIDKASGEDMFCVHEAYYNDDGDLCGLTDRAVIVGESLEDLEETLELIKQDLYKRPALVHGEIEYAPWNDDDNHAYPESK